MGRKITNLIKGCIECGTVVPGVHLDFCTRTKLPDEICQYCHRPAGKYYGSAEICWPMGLDSRSPDGRCKWIKRPSDYTY